MCLLLLSQLARCTHHILPTSYYRNVRPLRFPRLLVTVLSTVTAFQLPEPGGTEKMETNQPPIYTSLHSCQASPCSHLHVYCRVQLHRGDAYFLAHSSRKPSFSPRHQLLHSVWKLPEPQQCLSCRLNSRTPPNFPIL